MNLHDLYLFAAGALFGVAGALLGFSRNPFVAIPGVIWLEAVAMTSLSILLLGLGLESMPVALTGLVLSFGTMLGFFRVAQSARRRSTGEGPGRA